MYQQVTLEEAGMLPEQELPIGNQNARSQYACFCGGCICDHCANSVECIDRCTGEADFGCFCCDDCKGYDQKGADNWRVKCVRYKVTEAYAGRLRRNFKRIDPGK